MFHLREKIRFERATVTSDGFGGSVTVWNTFYEPKGVRVEQKTPSVDHIAGSGKVTSVIEITMRYNPEIAINKGDRAIWRGFTFVAMASVPDRINRSMKITAVADMETSNREI